MGNSNTSILILLLLVGGCILLWFLQPWKTSRREIKEAFDRLSSLHEPLDSDSPKVLEYKIKRHTDLGKSLGMLMEDPNLMSKSDLRDGYKEASNSLSDYIASIDKIREATLQLIVSTEKSLKAREELRATIITTKFSPQEMGENPEEVESLKAALQGGYEDRDDYIDDLERQIDLDRVQLSTLQRELAEVSSPLGRNLHE